MRRFTTGKSFRLRCLVDQQIRGRNLGGKSQAITGEVPTETRSIYDNSRIGIQVEFYSENVLAKVGWITP
jgi:hypothetical protein